MSTPTSTTKPLIKSKIPRPVTSKTATSKKASARGKVDKAVKKTNSDFSSSKYLNKNKNKSHHPNVKVKMCRPPSINATTSQSKCALLSEFDDIPFEPNQQALESILTNRGIVSGINVQSDKRSSVFPSSHRFSLMESHADFKHNSKVLQEKMRQLNVATSDIKQQSTELQSTPKQASRPSIIYSKIKQIDKENIVKSPFFRCASERKMLTPKTASGLMSRSASKFSTIRDAGKTSHFLLSAHKRQNQSHTSTDGAKHQPMSQHTVSLTEVEKKEPGVCKSDMNLQLNNIQPKSTELSEFDEIPFEPNEEALESILTNKGIVAGDIIRQSAIQSGNRSSVYSQPPTHRISMMESHADFKHNSKVLQEKLRQLGATPFEPSKKALESILTNRGIVSSTNVQESPIQSGKLSSVYQSSHRCSLMKSHADFMQNSKVLQEKMRQLNLATPNTKKKGTDLQSTPNQVLQPSIISHKMKQIDDEGTKRSSLFTCASERKVLKPKNSYGMLCRSASKLEMIRESGNSSHLHLSNQGKENKHNPSAVSSSSINSNRLMSQSAVALRDMKSEEISVCESDVYLHLKTNDATTVPVSCSQSFSSVLPGRDDFLPHTGGIKNEYESLRHNLNYSRPEPLIPLSLLMTPTPPRSHIGSFLLSSLSTPPSTPKYSSVFSSGTMSTWALKDIVSTPNSYQVSTHSSSTPTENVLLKSADPIHNTISDYSDQAYQQSCHSSQKGGWSYKFSHLRHPPTHTFNMPATASPQLTPRPILSSCLKTISTIQLMEQENPSDGKSSCVKKLRWADMAS